MDKGKPKYDGDNCHSRCPYLESGLGAREKCKWFGKELSIKWENCDNWYIIYRCEECRRKQDG